MSWRAVLAGLGVLAFAAAGPRAARAQGLPPAAVVPRPGRGNGLKNMRQRLQEIGGRCEIQSTPGAGAEIKFFISVPATARKNIQKFNAVIN